DIGRDIIAGSINRVPALSYLPQFIGEPTITPMSRLTCPYYFRVTALDQPGVLSTISGIFGKYRISLKSVMQKGRQNDEPVHIVFRSHRASEEAVEKAIAEIDALACCTVPTVKIRILVEDK
ncbi:MAG: ACT domain-containing protein, partial [Desulfoprunum sp.]|uniref:ACT domain-containing protein n=1 Tax=Desulfoprunum sp. TaxID=2020866 RepID=UPI003C72F44E